MLQAISMRFGRPQLIWAIVVLTAAATISLWPPAGASMSNIRSRDVVASVRNDYEAAKFQWESEGLVGSGAFQAIPLFLAEGDLKRALPLHPPNVAAIRAAVKELDTLGQMPDTGYTPALDAKWNMNQEALTRFFGVGPNAGVPSGLGFRAAESAWEKEPPLGSDGAELNHLRNAISDLAAVQNDLGKRRVSVYPAAIADLKELEAATRGDLSSDGLYEGTNDHTANRWAYEILFLNVFFSDGVFPAPYHWVLIGRGGP